MKIDFTNLKIFHEKYNTCGPDHHKMTFTMDGMYLGHIVYYYYFLDKAYIIKDELAFIDQDILDLISELQK